MLRTIVGLLALGAGACLAAQEGGAAKGEAKPEPEPAPQAAPAAAGQTPDGLHPRVRFETSLGDIIVEVDAERAPISAHNFIKYVEDKYYDGTIFHRVVPDFVIQGGGFTPDMKEKKDGLRPGILNEWQNGLKNSKGTLSMARQGGKPDSGTSQFFINLVDNDRLDQKQRDGAAYAVFGRVVEGMDVVEKIRTVETKPHPATRMPAPVEPVIVRSATLITPYDRSNAEKMYEASMKAAADAAARAREASEKAMEGALAQLEKEAGKKPEKTESGLYYVVLKPPTGDVSPAPTQTVEVHYTGWLLNGKKFDSSVDRGEPTSFPLNQVIRGWTEGVGLMKVGEKRKYLIPAQLAYGEQGRPPQIPPNSPLLFEIELLSIK